MEEELDLRELIQVLRVRWKIIAVAVLVGLAGAGIFTFVTYEPEYETSATLIAMIREGRIDELREEIVYDVGLSRQMVETFEELARSRMILEVVLGNLNLSGGSGGMSYESLKDKIEVSQVRETEILEIIVTDTVPTRAYMVANEVADVFIDKAMEIMDVNNIYLVDAAERPASPVGPNYPLNMGIGLVLGLMAGVGIAFLRESLDDTLKDPDKVQGALNTTALGMVPTFEVDKTAETNYGILVTFEEPNSTVSETYRSIRNNIKFATLDNPAQNFVVTSPTPAGGKTVTLANLGVMFAQAGYSVLLVDADMRRPSLHKEFNFLNSRGLTSLLSDENLTLDDVVKRTLVNNLYVLPSGPLPPNPAELLGSEKMERLAGVLAQRFDFIFYDTPPLAAVIDATALSAYVDGGVLIFKYGVSTYKEAQFAVEQLRLSKINLIGFVLNEVPQKSQGYYYYYKYGYSARY